MKTIKFLLIIIVLIQNPFIYSQLWLSRSEKLNIDKKREIIKKSGIKSKTLYIYTFENDKMKKKGFMSLWETEKYDTNGNTIEKYEFDFRGNFYKIKNTFDEKNRLTLSLWCDTNENNCYSRREYSYTDNNTVIERIINKENPSDTQLTHNKYDNKGNLIETVHSSVNGYSRMIYEYDKNLNVTTILEIGTYIKGITITHFKNIYDSSGNLTEKIQDSWDDSDERRFTNTYDKNGSKIQETFSSAFPKYSTISKYRYDDYGNLIYVFWYQGDGYPRVSLMKYDENGNMLEKINCDKNEKPASLYKYIYEYY